MIDILIGGARNAPSRLQAEIQFLRSLRATAAITGVGRAPIAYAPHQEGAQKCSRPSRSASPLCPVQISQSYRLDQGNFRVSPAPISRQQRSARLKNCLSSPWFSSGRGKPNISLVQRPEGTPNGIDKLTSTGREILAPGLKQPPFPSLRTH